MSKKRKNFCIILSFLGTVLLAVVLYAEKSNYDQTEKALRQIVLQDFTQTETFFNQNPEEMQAWSEYLSLPTARTVLNGRDPASQKRLSMLMTSLHFAHGVEKYPVFVNLYESLNSLQDWRRQNFLLVAFRGRNLLADLRSKRTPEKNAGAALLFTVGALPAEKKQELEKTFFAQLETELPTGLLTAYTETVAPSVAKSTSVLAPEPNAVEAAPNQGQPVGPARSPLLQRNQAVRVASGSEDSLASQSENGSLAQSGAVPGGTAPCSLPRALRTTTIPLPVFLNTQFIPALMEAGNYAEPREIAKVNGGDSGESQDLFALPDLSSMPEMSEEAKEDAKPEDSALRSEAKETEKVDSGTHSGTSGTEKAPVSREIDFPPLPFLHYSLMETVGAVGAVAPQYEGTETLEGLRSGLTGNFANDLGRIRKCWLAESFQAPSEEDLAEAYEAIGVASDSFINVLNRLSEEKRKSWINLLHLSRLNLNREPDLEMLQDVHERLSCGKIGLEMEIFVNFRNAIRHFLALVSQRQNPEKAKELFETARYRVLKLLEIVEKDHSSVNERALEDELVWLDCMGQASATVQVTRLMWNQPNVFINVDSSIFERFGSRVIEEEENILNEVSYASIRGKALFNGNLTVKPVVNENRIELGLVLDGSSNSRTRAYAGPAIISSRAQSRIQVQKSIYFDGTGFDASVADVQIHTNSQIEGVQDVRNRAIIQSLATRRAYAQKSSVEQSTNAQSTQRLRRRFDTQIDSMLETWNQRIVSLFQKQFRPRGIDQYETHSHSDESGAYVQTRLTCRHAMSACAAPPEMPQECDFQMAIHETVIQNAFSGYFSGMNLNAYARQYLKSTAPSFLQKVFAGESSVTDSEANWTMYFPESWPVSVSFQEGKICCVIHVERLDYEGKSYPAVDISVYYGIEAREDGFYLVRQGNVGIFPPDFNPEQKKRLPPSMISLRRVLGKRLEKEFIPEIALKERKLVKDPEKQDSNFGNLWMKPVFAQAKEGWFMVGMNLIEKDPCK